MSHKVEQAVQELIVIFTENSGISAVPSGQHVREDEMLDPELTGKVIISTPIHNYIPYLPAYKSHWSISRTRLKP